MKTTTEYLWFNTKSRQEFVRITDQVAAVVAKSGVQEGMVLVSAMHITAAVYVNDWEDGLIHDFADMLEPQDATDEPESASVIASPHA